MQDHEEDTIRLLEGSLYQLGKIFYQFLFWWKLMAKGKLQSL